MGNLVAKVGRRKKTRKNGSRGDARGVDGDGRLSGSSSQATSYYGSVYEEQMITLLRAQFAKQPHEVVLDQLLLLLPLDIDREFLESLKGAEEGGDIALVEKTSGAQLQVANVGLRAQHRRAICPDALAAAARYAVRWKAPHGPHKNQEFELLPSRLFLVQYNVAVEEYSASRWDPKPYTRLPGGGVRYVLRTEEVASARRKKPRAAAATTDAGRLNDQNRDAPPSGSVKLFVTLAPPAAVASAEGVSLGRFSEDSILSSSSVRGEDEDAERGVGADSGHESARSSEDRGLVDAPSSGEECEGGPRSPTDPLPPVPSSNDDTPHQQQQESSSTYWAGRPTLPATTPAETPRKVLGPAPERKPLKHVSAKTHLLPMERRLSGRLAPQPRAGTSLHHPQPPAPFLYRSNGNGSSFGPRSSGGSSRTSEDTDYGYAGSTGSGRAPPGSASGSVNGARALAEEPLRDGEIPLQCFRDVDLKRPEVAYTEDEDEDSDAGGNPLFIRRRYLLPHAYAQAMCVPPGIETPATCIVRAALAQAEWPSRLQLHWNTRQRAPATDPRTQKTCQWPTPADIDKVRSLGCFLVPNDSGDKTNTEWHYIFPAAEAYLESTLSGSQIRVFLAAAALVRASTEGSTLSDDAWVQWLRHTFFWLCERDCVGMSSWERPGRALVHLLDSFYEVLMSGKLRDYFVPARNMLAHADTKTIRFIQERLNRARENLLVHMVGAARGLKAHDMLVTIPPFDFRRLYQMLTSDDFVSFLNPTLGWSLKHGGESMLHQEESTDSARREEGADEGDAEEDIYDDSDEESDRDDDRRDNDEMQEWARKFRRQQEAEKAAEQLVEKPRPSVGSIDLKAVPPRIWDSLRRRLVLETLAEALVDRGTWAQSRGWMRLARVSARQAARMARLMEEIVDADPAVTLALRQRANKVEQMCNLARRMTHDQIEVRRTSFMRLPLRSETENAEVAGGIDELRHTPRSVPSLTLRDTTSGESLIIVEEEETEDEDNRFTNRRYSTIAEVHAELAVLRAGTTEEKSEENKVEDEKPLKHKSSTDGNNSSSNDALSGERKSSNSSTSSMKTKEETKSESSENKEVSLESRANNVELESEKHTVSEIVSTQDTKKNDKSEAVFDEIKEQEEEEEEVDDLDMRL